jgi:predicted nucleotidyltransferase
MSRKLTKERVTSILENELTYLRQEYGVVRIAVFGSFANGLPDEESDVDLLVELNRPLGFEFVSLARYLEERLGRSVDLATFETLNRSLDQPRYQLIAQTIQRTLTDVKATAG